MAERASSVSLSLSKIDTLRLLKLYRDEPCLYNVNTPGYRNQKERSAARRRIAAALSVNGFRPKEVAVKLKNLRNSYSQELKKLKDKKSGAIDVDVAKVYWFDVMDAFLRPYISTLAEKNPLCMDPETIKEEPNEESPAESSPSRSTSPSKWVIQQDDNRYTRSKRLCKTSIANHGSNGIAKETSAGSGGGGDEFIVFGQSVGQQLAKLPLRKALQVQHKIQTLLTHARLSELEPGHVDVSADTALFV